MNTRQHQRALPNGKQNRTPALATALLLASLSLTTTPAQSQAGLAPAQTPAAGSMQTVTVTAASKRMPISFDGLVEAVRQSVVAAQVAGAIVQLDVAAGDRVRQGQVLMRIDAQAADQTAAVSEAQVQAAQATLALASQDLERHRQLFQQQFISRAALDQAESSHRAARAQVNALMAQAGASRTQTAYHVVRAPFAGVVSHLNVSLGDMAMPGRPLLTLYDPSALRVTAAVPQTIARAMASLNMADSAIQIELAAATGDPARITPTQVQWLPTVDTATDTAQLRASVAPGATGVAPGMFARVWLSVPRADAARSQTDTMVLSVPASAIVRRAELAGVYVLNDRDRPVLRQVRLGRRSGEQVEVLAGLRPGDRVVTEPQAAARLR